MHPIPWERRAPARRDGEIIYSQRAEQMLGAPVIFSENGIRFEADVLRGQKTGFFLDQRENRAEVEKLAQGKKVLNAFSFSGGFSPEINIYDNKIIFMSWQEKFSLIIESQELADAFKKIFDLSWQEAKRLDKLCRKK